MRPAAFVAARPKPDVIRQQQRHPALTFATQHQERLAIRSLHYIRAGAAPDVDQPEPVAPVRRVAVRAFEIARHRVTTARFGELRFESTFGYLAGRFSRKYAVKRSTPDAGGARIVRPGCDHDRAAVAHVFGHA